MVFIRVGSDGGESDNGRRGQSMRDDRRTGVAGGRLIFINAFILRVKVFIYISYSQDEGDF